MTKDEKMKRLYRAAIGYQTLQSGGLAGQAITGYICLRCEKEKIHANTNAPMICRDCVDEVRAEFNKEGK